MIVYKITNIINGKVYIGQTIVSLQKRWNGHCNSRGGCRLLNSAIKKYGKDSFTKNIVENLNNLDELNDREAYWISFYQSNVRGRGYNLSSGGGNSLHSEETKRNISNSARGRVFTPESRAKMSLSRTGMLRPNARIQASLMHEKNRGVPLSEEHKRKLSAATKGKKISTERRAKLGKVLSDSTKNKIGVALKGKIVSNETREKMRKSATGRKMSSEARANMSANHFSKKRKFLLMIS